MSFANFISEKIMLPIDDLISGHCVAKSFRFLQCSSHWTQEQIEDYQNQKLKSLIRYTVENVPFYKEYFQIHGMTSDAIQSISELEKMPIVDKNLMRKEGINRFASEKFPSNKRILSHSSGSTGEPFAFYISKESDSVNTASKLLTWYYAGYRLGDKYMKIANANRKSFLKKTQDLLNNCIYIPFTSLNNESIVEILDKIEKNKPQIIRSYPAPLYIISQFRNKHGGYSYSPEHIMTTGATLSEAYRMEIEKAFGCDIIDSYSCEGNSNTYETTLHDGYNVESCYGITEIIDDDGKHITDGIGHVISTDLWNYAHPFIRYNTKDLVEVRSGRIIRIMGRECEALVNSVDGTLFTVHNFSSFFLHDIDSVLEYQIVKCKNGAIMFRLVVNRKYDESVRDFIIRNWSDRLGKNIVVEIVDEIPLLGNNKRLTIVDE